MDCKPCRSDRYIPPFAGWVPYNATIPKMYWDTYSQEQRIHAMCDLIHRVACYADMLGIELDKDHTSIEALEAEFEKFKESGFEDYYEEQLAAWIIEHMPDIISASMKMVWFGLTQNGYFVAYIPESWSDIVFDTGMVYNTPEYGRLILMYNVDGSEVLPDIEQQHTEIGIIGHELSNLEVRVMRNEQTLYDPIEENEG